MLLHNLVKAFAPIDSECPETFDIYLTKKDNVMYTLSYDGERIIISGLQVDLKTNHITIIHKDWEHVPIVLSNYTVEYPITLWVVFAAL